VTDDQTIREKIDAEQIAFVDLRAVDLAGRLRHLTLPAHGLTPDRIKRGVGFDASSYGYRPVSGSDLVLVPDPSTARVEVWGEDRVLAMMADIGDAGTGERVLDAPREIARRACEHLRASGVADAAVVSPEFEFYVFEAAQAADRHGPDGTRFVPVSGEDGLERGDLRETASAAYHAPLCHDPVFALRNRMARAIEAASIPVKYHHHEAGRLGQHEIEVEFAPLLQMADATLVVKDTVRRIARESGLIASFLPKPFHGEPGSGMHLHQFLLRGDVNLFATAQRGVLSNTALCYVGGILTHGRSLMAFTNPSTNSYRRLVPGYEAPTHLVCGLADRSAAVRIPAYAEADMTRIELRTMDATCNPYLAFAAILLAGLDGVARDLNAARLGLGPDGSPDPDGKESPRSLREALAALEADHEYLSAGGTFSEGLLSRWVDTKRAEADAIARRPHPYEVALYDDI
jgi:glutamine synthetase